MSPDPEVTRKPTPLPADLLVVAGFMTITGIISIAQILMRTSLEVCIFNVGAIGAIIGPGLSRRIEFARIAGIICCILSILGAALGIFSLYRHQDLPGAYALDISLQLDFRRGIFFFIVWIVLNVLEILVLSRKRVREVFAQR